MAIKPILFNTEMVRAILDGSKTCTRRVIKPQPDEKNTYPLGFITDSTEKKEVGCFGFAANEYGSSIQYVKPPYRYAPGDILYVRETVWQKIGYYLDIDGETKPSWYNEFKYVASDEKPETGWNYSWAKRPSIHMPKEAARIWIKVTDVSVERLQDIDGKGCVKEGIEEEPLKDIGDEFVKGMFHDLWDSIIKKSDLDRYGWDANPWVWVIEFELCKKPKGEN